MNITRFLGVLVLSAVLLHCAKVVKSENVNPGQGPLTVIVSMKEFKFQPESLNVFTGDTVTWVNHGDFPHTTTSLTDGKPDGLWDSGEMGRGKSFSYVFSRAGTYHYFCRAHHSLGMKGVVVVAGR